MDITQIINLLTTFWYLIPVFVVLFILRSAWFKGKTGEFIVNLYASIFLDKKTYHVIKDVTLPITTGSTQIDHVIVSVFGVFVIETKNMTGWIFGDERQRQWTQIIYKHKSKFQNPLHQNYKHVRVLQDLLGLTNDQIQSVVVFVGDNRFKTPMPPNVTKGSTYLKFIKSFTNPVISEDRVNEVVDKINSGRLEQSFRTNREHINQLNIKHQYGNNDPVCSRCGSSMVKRVAKKGINSGKQFWGCSQFPKCKGTAGV